MPSKTIRIATRRSPLAMWQANHIKTLLELCHHNLKIQLIPLATQGDKLLQQPLNQIGGKGLFVKELEQALIEHRADIAVHSMKDLPAQLPDEFLIGAICPREDPRDALVTSLAEKTLDSLPKRARIGTSSLRRRCQILSKRPDLQVSFLRGNINTRLKKLTDGDFDAIILAAAGLIRLKIPNSLWSFLSSDELLPAVGQGAIGIEVQKNDPISQKIIAPLHDTDTGISVSCERNMNLHLGGNCQVPIGGYAKITQNKICLRGLVGMPNGSSILQAQSIRPKKDYLQLGKAIAEALLAQGAKKILLPLSPEYNKESPSL